MRNSKIVELDGKDLVVKELTPADFDTLLAPNDDYQATWLDRILDKDNLSGSVLAAATGLSEKKLSAMAPSALRPVITAFKEVNPDFLETARLEKERAEEIQKMLGENSGAAAALLSTMDTPPPGDTE